VDLRRLDERIEGLSSVIEELAKRDAGRERLIPGSGPIISSAMVAAIGTGDAFAKGRDFAAWLTQSGSRPKACGRLKVIRVVFAVGRLLPIYLRLQIVAPPALTEAIGHTSGLVLI
jgi:hypothetical protein